MDIYLVIYWIGGRSRKSVGTVGPFVKRGYPQETSRATKSLVRNHILY